VDAKAPIRYISFRRPLQVVIARIGFMRRCHA